MAVDLEVALDLPLVAAATEVAVTAAARAEG
jgi:hypothetical protein